MTVAKSRRVYALVMTSEENGVHQHVSLWARKREPDLMRREIERALSKDTNASRIAVTLEKLQLVPAKGVAGLPMAYAVALTYQGTDGPAQSVEVFNRHEDAEAARESHERSFNDGSRPGLIALTLHDDLLITPAIDGE
jgi:hypothetical protein